MRLLAFVSLFAVSATYWCKISLRLLCGYGVMRRLLCDSVTLRLWCDVAISIRTCFRAAAVMRYTRVHALHPRACGVPTWMKCIHVHSVHPHAFGVPIHMHAVHCMRYAHVHSVHPLVCWTPPLTSLEATAPKQLKVNWWILWCEFN